MRRTTFLFALFSAALLLPAIAAAQGFDIFVKKKVAVADVIDHNDRELTEGVKTAIRQSMMDVCTNSEEYAVYEVNMEDVKQQLKAKGLPVNFANICKIIKQKADYIIFPAVKVSTSALGARDVIINITATLYRLDTGTEHLSRTVEAKPDVQSIITSSSQMVAQMLGIEQTTSSRPSQHTTNISRGAELQQQPSYQQSHQPKPATTSGNISLTKSELQRAGFRFATRGKAVSVSGVHGSTNIVVESFSNGNVSFKPHSYYSGYLNHNGRLCGLVLFKEDDTWYITYCVDGEVAYPILHAYYYVNRDNEKSFMLCVTETFQSYGIRRVNAITDMEDWSYFGSSNDRLLADEFVKIFGTQIKTIDFLKKFANGQVDLNQLNRNFVSYIKNGNIIPPFAWEENKLRK